MSFISVIPHHYILIDSNEHTRCGAPYCGHGYVLLSCGEGVGGGGGARGKVGMKIGKQHHTRTSIVNRIVHRTMFVKRSN